MPPLSLSQNEYLELDMSLQTKVESSETTIVSRSVKQKISKKRKRQRDLLWYHSLFYWLLFISFFILLTFIDWLSKNTWTDRVIILKSPTPSALVRVVGRGGMCRKVPRHAISALPVQRCNKIKNSTKEKHAAFCVFCFDLFYFWATLLNWLWVSDYDQKVHK